MTLLAHLVQRFATHPENIASDGLTYVLQTSPPARAALRRFVEAASGRKVAVEQFEAQWVNDDLSRPDIVGTDAERRRTLLIEVKFWAGLTDAQPVGYLASMTTPGVLLFVAPEARLTVLWRELVRRVQDASLEPEVDALGARMVVGGHVMAATSWRALLAALSADANLAGDHKAGADLAQLQDLCERMDTEAFLPLTSEELTGTLGRRVMQFAGIASELTEMLISRGLADVKGLKATSRAGVSGRYLRLKGRNAFLHFDAERWAQLGDSPLWLSLMDDDWREAEDQNFPIRLTTGVEKAQVMADCLSQIQDICDSLPAPAGPAS